MACAAIGSVLITLLLAGFLYWNGQPAVVVGVAAVAIGLCCGVPVAVSQACLNLITPTEKQQDVDDEDLALYQMLASYTVSKPKEWYCWFRLLLDFVFLFLWPMAHMYAEGLFKIATLVLVLGAFSGARIYFDSRWVWQL